VLDISGILKPSHRRTYAALLLHGTVGTQSTAHALQFTNTLVLWCLDLLTMASMDSSLVRVKTTLPTKPLPANSTRQVLKTKRLIIRPLTPDDLEAMHSLRTQTKVMACTALGRVDRDLAETQTKLEPFLPPRDADTYNPAICLATTGELIGLGGVYGTQSPLGWPEVGYMIRSEYWGRGYATEFLRAFLQMWWALPRSETEAWADGLSLVGVDAGEGAGGEVPEMLCAIVQATNIGSTRVLEKAGFRKFKTWKERSHRVESGGSGGDEVTLVGFVAFGPEPQPGQHLG